MREALFVYHSILVSLLIVATFIDLDWMIIPDSVTIPGMLLGVGLGTFWFVELHPVPLFSPPMSSADLTLLEPGWLPDWLSSIPSAWEESLRQRVNLHWQMNWNRWLGFLTSAAGFAAGWSVVWVVRWICTWAFGKEAMGFGDVTLMAMIGSFVGWQTVILAFFLAPLSAVVVGLLGWLFAGRGELPYGPHLSIATIVILFFWRNVWFVMEPLFADMTGFAVAAAAMLVLLAITAGAVQRVKRFYLRLRGA
jgi:leader peptidase (prepilin peptidase)/N-methyltransferase